MSTMRERLVDLFENTPADEPGPIDGAEPGSLHRQWSIYMADQVMTVLGSEPEVNLERVRREIESRIRSAIAYGAGRNYRSRSSQERADWIQHEVAAAIRTLDAPVADAGSLLPRDQVCTVDAATLARDLARELDHSRSTAEPIPDVVARYFFDHEVQLPRGISSHWVGAGIAQVMGADEVFDSEQQRAARAVVFMFNSLIGGDIRARGWFNGEQIAVAGVTYTLTGAACPQCSVNPEASSAGGGVRCISVACGYWNCA